MTAPSPQLDARALYALLLARGCTVRVEDGDKLWVTPLASLAQGEIAAIRAMKLKLIALHGERTAVDTEERLSEVERLDIIGPAPVFVPPAGVDFTRFDFAPRGVSEAEFQANVESRFWLWQEDGEATEMAALLARYRPQVREILFDQYGPLQSLRMADDLYFELFRFRQARFTRINAAARRKQAMASEDVD